jgi:hypothetical protein
VAGVNGPRTDGRSGGGRHGDLPPELRRLAQTLLDRIDPAVRLAAARAQGASTSPGRCQQVWCPVCALMALVQGDQHPMLDVVAEHSVALLTLVRALLDDLDPGTPGPDGPGAPPPDAGTPSPAAEPPAGPGHYQHIPVQIDE